MISSNFGFGEQSKIASAYAQMYAPKSKMEESCNKGGCEKKTAKKPVKEACGNGGLVKKHVEPKKTGSKLGVRKMLPFDKRDAKPSAKKFTPPVKNSAKNESVAQMTGYCITDGDKTLCTNDVNESYFSKEGITGETRIYESAVSALKDIKKVSARRNPNKKYCIRKCQCVGESFEFSDKVGTKVDESQKVNEGWFDGITNAVGSAVDGIGNVVGGAAKGLTDAGAGLVKGVGNVAGNIPIAGGLINGATDALGNAISGAGNVVNQAATGLTGVGSGLVRGAGNTIQGGVDSVTNHFTGDDKEKQQSAQPQTAQVQPQQQQQDAKQQQTQPTQPQPQTAQAQKETAQPQQQVAQPQTTKEQQPQKPLTQAQTTAAANGAGPVTDAAAQNNPAVKAQQQQKQQQQASAQSGQHPMQQELQNDSAAKSTVDAVSPTMPDSVKNYMTDGLKNGGQSQQQDNASKKADIQKQIAALQKQLQELA